MKTLLLLLGILTFPAFADDEASFLAEVDRSEITTDESVSLKLSITASGNLNVESLKFDAPDFDLVNEYNSTFIESYYENGRFGMRNNQKITKVLRPKKGGKLSITNLEVRVSGKPYHASPIFVLVKPGGSGTPPPKYYSGNSGAGLRGSGKQSKGHGFFVRAEVNKQKAVKGEQLIVSYYLYHRVRITSPQVEKFPTLTGFLREDLEMPIMGQRLNSEKVVFDGATHRRSLLMRYAAYPLKEGKLTIDPIEIKLSYFSNRLLDLGEENDPIQHFFQSMMPNTQTAIVRSEPITVEVAPLPNAGRPSTFSGGVGHFTMTTAVDKYQVKTNEPITVVVKIEGHGNVSAIEEPKAQWPSGIELYESKGRTKTGAGGMSERDFEFLIIPRTAGKWVLPPIEVSFYDPEQRAYVTQKTDPIPIEVEPGNSHASSTPTSIPEKIHGLLPSFADSAKTSPQHQGPSFYNKLGQNLGWVSLSLFALAVLGMGLNQIRRHKRYPQHDLKESLDWNSLLHPLNQEQVLQYYDELCSRVYDAIDRKYAIGARSFSRAELERILVYEKGLSIEIWQIAKQLLEFSEAVRFTDQASTITKNAAHDQFLQWVKRCQEFHKALSGNPAQAKL